MKSLRAAPDPPKSARQLMLAADWPAFYREHVDFVWRSLRRMGVPTAQLDDATQEVFVTVFRYQQSFEGRSSVKTWLYGIAFNIAMRATREGARVAREALVDSLPDESASPPEQLQRAQAIELFYRALAAIEPARRAVFVMALDDMSAPEIAEASGVPVNTVYSRLRTARQEFEMALARYRAADTRRQP